MPDPAPHHRGTNDSVVSAHAFDDELARLDAVATADLLAAGELSVVEVVSAAVERAERLDPAICAVAVADHERAVAAARTASGRAGGARAGALAGVPTYIKDMVDVAGLPTTWGSRALEGGPPARANQGIAVTCAEIGMVFLGKSAMPEMGFIPSTEPAHAPSTRNPWNVGHTAGGSSGGAAALVAAGVVPIAHAADGGGSIRIPAASCGLVGLKPTRGRLPPHPEDRVLPVAVTVDGVVTRTVRDTAAFYAEAESRHRNPRLPAMGLVEGPPSRRLRVGALCDLPIDVEVDGPTRRTFDDTVALLGELGHEVEPVDAPVGAEFADDFLVYFEFLAYLATSTARLTHGRHVKLHRFTDFTHGLADSHRRRRRRVVGAARRLRRSTATMEALHERYDILLSPTLTRVPPELGHLSMALDHEVLLPRVIEWMAFTPLANAAGTPAISLPMGFDDATGLPIGMMFGGAAGADALLVELAFELEAARPWPRLGETSAR